MIAMMCLNYFRNKNQMYNPLCIYHNQLYNYREIGLLYIVTNLYNTYVIK
jgi:hypothetical protein